MKMTHRLMYQKNKGGHWETYETWSEKDARSEANRLWQEGYYKITLYERVRDGWMPVKEVKQNERVAEAKQKAHLEELARQAGCTINFQ